MSVLITLLNLYIDALYFYKNLIYALIQYGTVLHQGSLSNLSLLLTVARALGRLTSA